MVEWKDPPQLAPPVGTPGSQLCGAAIDEKDQGQKDLQLDTKDQSLPERSTAEDTGGATMSQAGGADVRDDGGP